MANRLVGLVGGGGHIDIIVCDGKGLACVKGDQQEQAGCDGVGRDAETDELESPEALVGNGIAAVAEYETQPQTAASGEASAKAVAAAVLPERFSQ